RRRRTVKNRGGGEGRSHNVWTISSPNRSGNMKRLDIYRMQRKHPGSPAPAVTTLPALGGALAVALFLSTAARAQEATTVIVVNGEVRAVAEQYLGGHLDVQVDGVQCGRWSMGEANRLPGGGSEFELGADDQPEECRRAGGTIRFLDGNFTV